ncbi:hypothetical protein LTR85_006842 [Meristemomyces frigidus]|nr:hypothetical protein LTR85_006842 [Meristemomyces frigidus]
MPSAWHYWKHTGFLAGHYVEDNPLQVQDDPALSDRYEQYCRNVIEASLCVNRALEVLRNKGPEHSADVTAATTQYAMCADVLKGDQTLVDLMTYAVEYYPYQSSHFDEQMSLQDWEAVLDELKRSPLDRNLPMEADKDKLADNFWAALDSKHDSASDNCNSASCRKHRRRPLFATFVDVRAVFDHPLGLETLDDYRDDFGVCVTSQLRKRRAFLNRLELREPPVAFQYVPSERATKLAKQWVILQDLGDRKFDKKGLLLLEAAICEEMRILPSSTEHSQFWH